MRQLSLIDDEYTTLSGAMPSIKAALRRVAGDENSEGRKLLVDKINKIARISGVKLTGGNVRAISKDTPDKWLSPSDESHPPSVVAILAFALPRKTPPHCGSCFALPGWMMTEEDRLYTEIGRRSVEAKRKNAEAKKARRLIQRIGGKAVNTQHVELTRAEMAALGAERCKWRLAARGHGQGKHEPQSVVTSAGAFAQHCVPSACRHTAHPKRAGLAA